MLDSTRTRNVLAIHNHDSNFGLKEEFFAPPPLQLKTEKDSIGTSHKDSVVRAKTMAFDMRHTLSSVIYICNIY